MIEKTPPSTPLIRLILALSLCVALVFAAQFVRQNLAAPEPRIGGDFVAFHGAGAVAADDGVQAVYRGELAAHAAAPDAWTPRTPPYPPCVFFLLLPLGMLSYMLALALWMGGTLAGYVYTARRMVAADGWALAFVCAGPGVVCNAMAGQTGFLTAALMIGAAAAMMRRTHMCAWAAGVMLGVLSLKPQLAVLFPVALVAMRRWDVLAIAAGTVAVLVFSSVALFGAEAWALFAKYAGVFGGYALGLPGDLRTMTASLYGWLRLLEVPAAYAFAAQGALACGAAVAVWRVFRNGADARACMVLLSLSFIVSPYVMAYDMVALAVPAVWLAQRMRCGGGDATDAAAVLLAGMLPLLVPQMNALYVPLAPLTVLLLAWRVFRRKALHSA